MNKLNSTNKKLFGAIVGLAKVCGNYPYTKQTIDNIKISCKAILDCDDAAIENYVEIINESKYALSPNCRLCASPCGNSANRNFLQIEKEENCKEKTNLLFALAEFSQKNLTQDDEFCLLKCFAMLDDQNIKAADINELQLVIKDEQ